MTGELPLYGSELRQLLDRLCATVEGLDEPQLNWRPPTADSNSVYVIAAHILGNLEAWVLGIACREPIERDRPAEFRAAGPHAAPLIAQAGELARRVEDALGALPPAALDEVREPSASLRGVGPAEPLTAREALMVTIQHAATHLGQLDITRDWAQVSVKG